MIRKKTATMWAVVLVIVTFMLTYAFSNVFYLSIGDRILVPKEEFESLEKLLSLKKMIKAKYVEDSQEDVLIEGAMKGMFESLGDPYSVYMTEQEFKNFAESTSGSYGGIGVIITTSDDGYITVVAPIEDTPGERVGLKTNDKIIKVDDHDIVGWDQDKAVSVMKGEPGTEVALTVVRDKSDQPLVFEIKRERINIKYVKSEMIEDDIGYIRISMFDEDTGGEFKNSIKKLQAQKMKGLVIDLRQNPGGYVRECIEVADELLDKGVIFYAEDKHKQRDTYKSKDGKVEVPFVILVDGGSASASEIVSGAVKDRKAGIIVGTRTFGKGLVQSIEQLRDGSGFKLTTQKYYTPSGVSIHKVGVEPDIVIEPVEEDVEERDEQRDIQLETAIDELNKQIR